MFYDILYFILAISISGYASTSSMHTSKMQLKYVYHMNANVVRRGELCSIVKSIDI